MTTRRKKPAPLFTAGGKIGRRKILAAPFSLPFPLDGLALQEWERIIHSAYWLKESESVAIADRCLCVQRVLECEEDIRQRGHVIKTRNGMVLNPSIRTARSYRISLQRHDETLGLTASSRGRLVEPVPTFEPGSMNDPLERALCGDMKGKPDVRLH